MFILKKGKGQIDMTQFYLLMIHWPCDDYEMCDMAKPLGLDHDLTWMLMILHAPAVTTVGQLSTG